jgi:outer membrane protein insertion porin family
MVLACLGFLAVAAHAQPADLAHRPVADVRVEGVREVDQQLVRNQIRMRAGRPYDPDTVARDIENITRLGRFSSVRARVEPNDDGTLTLVYTVEEQSLLADVRVVGNRALSDQRLLEAAALRAGQARDPFLIARGRDRVTDLYRERGYYLAEVTVDEETLEETGVLIYSVREGPRVRVRNVRFLGNEAFEDDLLAGRVRTREYFPLLERGVLSEERIARDVNRVREYYRDRGYRDVRVGRRITLSDDQLDAVVTFIVDEGPQYLVEEIVFEGNTEVSDAQLIEAMPLKRGDVFSADTVQRAHTAVEDLYGKAGYILAESGIEIRDLPVGDNRLRVVVRLNEGRPHTVGGVVIRGNNITKDNVLRRHIRGIRPGRVLDTSGVAATEDRLLQSGLVSEARVTLQQTPEDEVRDVLIEVKEARTGSLNLGAALSSDAGVLGSFSISQRNFDIAAWPESWEHLISGQAFRGAGQQFDLHLQPGSELQRYQVRFTEPHLAESDYSLSTDAFYFTRDRHRHDEERLGGSVGFGRRFGDVWSANVTTRVEAINIRDIGPKAPRDVFDVRGSSVVDTLGFSVVRNTTDSWVFPTRGSRLSLGAEQAGAFGDYSFTRATAEYKTYWTVDEDFLGRKTVLSLRLEAGQIFGSAPVFERFYAGGHQTFRGFNYRGAGPRGIRNDTGRVGEDPVGGDFLFLAGLEYNFPVWEEALRGVVFVDSGTVDHSVRFDKYRVSVGAGVRLRLPILGQAPIALDLAYPIVREPGDDKQIFSFNVALPF